MALPLLFLAIVLRFKQGPGVLFKQERVGRMVSPLPLSNSGPCAMRNLATRPSPQAKAISG